MSDAKTLWVAAILVMACADDDSETTTMATASGETDADDGGSCPEGDCEFVCEPGTDCDFDCSGGGCSLTCEDGTDCSLDCDGADCNVTCLPSGATCALGLGLLECTNAGATATCD